MKLTAVNIAINAVYYAITAILAPWLAMFIEQKLGFARYPSLALRVIAVLVALPSMVLQLWCILLLQRHGGGTPSPAQPTSRLVTSGPYRWVRNPLNIGEIGLFLGLAAWFGSAALLLYALLAWAAFHLFVVLHEEPRHEREMGQAYVLYRKSVARWLPGLS